MFKQIGNIQIRISINKVTKVKGYNNNLPDGKFFPVWDFDNIPLKEVAENLLKVQGRYKLPLIRIVVSSPNHYHAICFKSMGWSECISILFNTDGLDKMFLSLAMARGYATLRITSRKSNGFTPHTVIWLHSKQYIKDDSDTIQKLIKGVMYDTRAK